MKDLWKPCFSREKRGFLMLVLSLGFFFVGPALADSPIYQGPVWDAAPAAAYNSQRGEFLVVWNVFSPLFGPVMGQLIKENGDKVRAPFEIITSGGVLPRVAYNAQKNEYLVVAESNYSIVGQRVGALGMKVGGLNTYLNHANLNDVKYRVPRVLYNSLAGTYLVAGASWNDTPSCTLQIYTLPVGASGQPLASATRVADESYSYCSDGAIYALEYAPIASTQAPQGRYLLAVSQPDNYLRMLDSQGQLLRVWYDPIQGTWKENVPFQALADPKYNVDIAYGMWDEKPVFFLVWGDPIGINVPGHGIWTGIWGGIVDAAKELYLTTDTPYNVTFPVSYQWNHFTTDPNSKTWKPVAKYNPAAGTFVVAWRETPLGDPRDLTNVNHIRVNTVSQYATPPPQDNLVVSSTGGTEDPKLPAIAASGKTAAVLIAWEDYRNGWPDIYGTMFDAGARITSGINPGGSIPAQWKSVSAGSDHSLGIKGDGSLWAWGANSNGQLGTGGEPEADQPVPVPVAQGSTWSQVSAGYRYTQGIKTDGGLWAWGINDEGQLGTGVQFTDLFIPFQVTQGSMWSQVSAGYQHTLGIRTDGSLWAWGANSYGQIGIGESLVNQPTPMPVASGSSWFQASAGEFHSLGIKTDGHLWAWGSNYKGALGIGIPPGETHEPSEELNVGPFAQVSAGYYYSLGIRPIRDDLGGGDQWAWGINDYGQLGIGEPSSDYRVFPSPLPPGGWVQVSAGHAHSLGIKTDGSLWAWGDNLYGQLGLGSEIKKQYSPFQVGNETDWVSVSAGRSHSLGLRSDGCLYAWGLNDHGQLGLGDIQERHVPTLIPFSCPSLNPPPVPIGLRLWLPLILKQ
jgi:alpha-tubulin suppressor-like RCC1 family protein